MPISPFRRVRSQDDDIRQLQDAAGFVFQDLSTKEILDGKLIKDILLNGTKAIEHKLQRRPNGYIVVFKDADESIWDSQSTNNLAASSLILNSTGAVKITIWVF